MDLTPKQQTSEAIRQADSIVILTGQHPSVDQTVAVLALAMILRKFGKQATPVITDTLPQAVSAVDASMIEKSLGGARDFVLKLDVTKAEVDTLRYEMVDGKLNVIITPLKGSFAPSDVTFDYGQAQAQFDLAIVLGVPARSRIDRIYEQNASLFSRIPVINLDYHRSNESYGAVNLIDSNASSLCEILVALSESLQGGIIDADIATPLLMGLVASTDRFTANHTTSKSLTVAAQMMAAGAKQQTVVKALYRDGRSGDSRSNDGRADRSEGRDTRDGRNSDNRSDRDRQSSGRGSSEPRRESAPSSNQPARQSESRQSENRQSDARQSEGRQSDSRQPEPRQAEPRQPEARREPEARRDSDAILPSSVTAMAAEPMLDARDNELPIIAPGHIELTTPEVVLARPVESEMPPASASLLATEQESRSVSQPTEPAAPVAAAMVMAQPVIDRPGQLPAEMSPLVDLSAEPVSVHPNQAALDMSLPTSVRNGQ